MNKDIKLIAEAYASLYDDSNDVNFIQFIFTKVDDTDEDIRNFDSITHHAGPDYADPYIEGSVLATVNGDVDDDVLYGKKILRFEQFKKNLKGAVEPLLEWLKEGDYNEDYKGVNLFADINSQEMYVMEDASMGGIAIGYGGMSCTMIVFITKANKPLWNKAAKLIDITGDDEEGSDAIKLFAQEVYMDLTNKGVIFNRT